MEAFTFDQRSQKGRGDSFGSDTAYCYTVVGNPILYFNGDDFAHLASSVENSERSFGNIYLSVVSILSEKHTLYINTHIVHVEDVNNDWPVSTPRIAATRRPEQAYPYTPALRNFPMPLRRLLDLD